MQKRILIESAQFALTVDRLCHQLIEQHKDFSDSVIIGVQPRGIFLSDRIVERLKAILPKAKIEHGKLDITFYRDDFRVKGIQQASETDIPFSVENKKVILVDDVLYTGRTIRSALDAMLDYGRPTDVELLVMIDRRLHRHLPIEANYVGKVIDSISSEKVKVEWKETDGKDKIWIIKE
ncbi:MAG TPA: bifunctional pyr operon transcriptional regulator/uracil phosphoribosyltransferase PyrR [Chitinophagales bacterium]